MQVQASHFPYLYESLLSQEEVDGQVRLLLEEDEDRSIHGILTFEQKDADEISFIIPAGGASIPFSRRLCNADIFLTGDISLGRSGRSFELGPAVRLECGTVRTRASEIRVLGDGADGSDVVVEAQAYEHVGDAPLGRITVHEGGTLVVSWPNVAHPWAPYRGRTTGDVTDPRLLDAFRRFTKILAPFRSHKFGGLTRRRQLVDNRPVGRTPMGRAVHEYLQNQNVLQIEGGFYRLNKEILARLGVDWQRVIMRREITPGVRDFLMNLLRNRADV
jgi:hypothetical protein